MKKIFIFCTAFMMAELTQAQFPANLNEDLWQQGMNRTYVTGNAIDIELWPNGAPNSNGVVYDQPVKAGQGTIDLKPGLKVVLPPKSDKPSKAVVICPGGGYAMLATMHEGIMWNFFFSRENVATIMLTYRLPHGHHEVPASDVYQAIRIVKEHAKVWNIDPDQIGVMGSSAGGHLASTVATHASDDVRPAFQILFYPVITMDKRYTHMGTHDNLIGKDATPEMEKLYSNEKQVTEKTPRAFIVLADDDDVVPSINSAWYFAALKDHGVPANMHVYPTGGHGFGNSQSWKYNANMLTDLADWLHSF